MSSRPGFGQRRFRITPEVVESWMVNSGMVKTNLPEDARFLRMYPEKEGGCYYVIFESKEWDEIEEGAEIPGFGIEVENNPITLKVKK